MTIFHDELDLKRSGDCKKMVWEPSDLKGCILEDH